MMTRRLSPILLAVCAAALLAPSTHAAEIISCNSNFTKCLIPENVSLQFSAGFLAFGPAISGDVVLLDPSGAVSDVFRIFNDFFDSGQGTGLGTTAFLYSSDDSTPLPPPSTYSANVKFLPESPSGITDYTNNGTTYVLAAPEPSTVALFLGGALALFVLHRKRAPRWKTGLFVALAFICLPAFAQDPTSVDPLPPEAAKYNRPMAPGPAQQSSAQAVGPAAVGLPFYTANYPGLGSQPIPFNIIGTDPALGANTSTVNTAIVALNLVFQSAGGLSLNGANVVAPTVGSPIFAVADYSTGGTDLGVTQYGDAIQRGQFWNLPGFSPNYHVLLGSPQPVATLPLTIPASVGNVYRSTTTGTLIGVVASGYLDSIISALGSAFGSQTVPILLTDNVFESDDGTIQTCCILGYHTSQGPPAATAATWIYAAYTEAGTFRGDAILDVQALSHEVAEWINDPFAGALVPGFVNLIPPAVLPGTGGACIINFETGDPLEAPPVVFTQTTNGKTYHLQDEVFLPWYLHTTPSFSVNGFYTFLNTFPGPSTLCGPG